MKVAIIYNKDLTGVLNKFGMQNKEFYSEKNVQRVANCLELGGHNTRVIDGNMFVIERLQHFMPKAIDGDQMGMVFNMAYGIQGLKGITCCIRDHTHKRNNVLYP